MFSEERDEVFLPAKSVGQSLAEAPVISQAILSTSQGEVRLQPNQGDVAQRQDLGSGCPGRWAGKNGPEQGLESWELLSRL